MNVAKCGVFEYQLIRTKKEKRTYTKYIYTFLVEYNYTSSAEYVNKAKIYLNRSLPIYFAEEENGTYYVYVRKHKRELMKGVNRI